MKAVFQCYEEPMDELEVNTQIHTVRLTMKPSCGEDAHIILDKKDVVGLIQILSECLLELE